MKAPATASPSVSDAATLKAALDAAQARADAAEHHSAILEAKSQLESSNLAVMQVDLAGFAVLMTIIVIFFSLRATNEAKAEARSEARNVARDEIKATRDELGTLHDAVAKARTEADLQMNEIKSLVGRVQQTESEGRDLLSRIRDHESQASKASAAVVLFSQSRSAEARPGEQQLKPEVTAALEAAAEEAKDTAQNRWTIDQFRSAILKAIYADQDHQRGAALATDMATRFPDDPTAIAFALESLGEVAAARTDWTGALNHYQQAIEWHRKAGTGESSKALRTRHQIGFVLYEMNRAAEAEMRFRELLPLRKQINGAEDGGTLVTRHGLACAVLDQEGRAAEAKAMFLELLPLCEEVVGAQAGLSRAVRTYLADATLATGDALAAEQILAMIPDIPNPPDWLPKHAANLAFVRGKVADAIGNTDEAAQVLSEAQELYEKHLPVDYARRRKFELYMESRR